MSVCPEVRGYLRELVARLEALLGDRLLAVYALGGIAFDDYAPGSSDVDIYAVVSTALDETEKRAVADCCRHGRLPCPARKLELVVVSAAAARQPGSRPRWELNLNTGPGGPDHVGLDPDAEPSHWFVIDLAIARERGVALVGPPAAALIGAARADDVGRAQHEVVSWYAEHGTVAEVASAACRAWHWFATGEFASKRDAVRWAAARIEDEAPLPGVTPAQRPAS